MFSKNVGTLLASRSIHYGWVMVAVTFFAMLATASAMGMPGVLLVPLHNEFGWSSSAMSGAMALRLIFFGFVGPFAAGMMQRYGVRFTVMTAMTLIVVGLTCMTRMSSLWQLWLFWGAFVGTGTGMTAIVLGATVTTRWFVKRRGLVLGILTASAASGQLLFLPAAAWLDEHLGWRFAVTAPIAACLLAALLVFLFGANHPRDLGLYAYGESDDGSNCAAPEQRRSLKLVFGALNDAVANRMFWILLLTFAVCGFTTNGLIQTHFIPFCGDIGLSPIDGAGVLALMGVFDFIGTIFSGWLADRFNNRWLLAFYFVLRSGALLLLPLGGFSSEKMAIFAMIYGLEWIATVPPIVQLATQEFGRERAPVVFGWIFTGHQIGAAMAAFGAGVIRDKVGTYVPAFMIGSGLCLAAAILVAPLWRKWSARSAVPADRDVSPRQIPTAAQLARSPT